MFTLMQTKKCVSVVECVSYELQNAMFVHNLFFSLGLSLY